MYDLNKVMLIGRLTRDPETRTTNTGKKVTTISLAMTMSKNKDTGNSVVEYIECTAWEKLAEIIEKYATKGVLVYVEGSIQTQSWENTDGKKQYKTSVLLKELKILTPKNSYESDQSQNQVKNKTTSKTLTPAEVNELPDIDLDEIQTPF
jgi:single-strand DNA-binding protein